MKSKELQDKANGVADDLFQTLRTMFPETSATNEQISQVIGGFRSLAMLDNAALMRSAQEATGFKSSTT